MLTIVTMGPSGSNHDIVSASYAAAIGLEDSRVELVDTFRAAVMSLLAGHADCMIQCAAHPDVAWTIGANREHVAVVDTFIAPARMMAILCRRDSVAPKSIAFHPATRDYADLTAWTEQIEEQSTVRVAEGLLSGKYECGLTTLEFAEENPGLLRIEKTIAPPDDAWLVYATKSVSDGKLVAWRDSPGAALLRSMQTAERCT